MASRGSTYRTRAPGSEVQEDLFKQKKTTSKKVPTDAVVLSSSDLQRMKEAAAKRDAAHGTRDLVATKDQKEAAAQARKERMLAMEEQRKKAEPKSDLQVEHEEHMNNILQRAHRAREENHDDAKKMNSIILYAKCATIRESQLEEKERLKREAEIADRLADQMMDIERQKSIQMYEEREKQAAVERLKGAAVIRSQIEARERERQHEAELRDQEAEALMRQIEQMKIEEQKAHIAKIEHQRKMRDVVMAANAEQIARKVVLAEEEKEEDLRIQEYIKEKEAREAAHQAELERIAQAKELEVARLRAQQEKASDKQAERDALRAKRAQEAYERQYREQELAAARKREGINTDLARAREQQQAERERRLADMARQEKKDFERIIQVQKGVIAAESEKEHQETMRRRMHSEEVRTQIAEKENERRKQRQEFFEEGRQLRLETEKEKARLELIKTRKIEEMREAGVPPKYLVQLEKKQMLQSKW